MVASHGAALCDHRARSRISGPPLGVTPEGEPMKTPLHAKPSVQKPSGTVTYKLSQGANVWPGTATSDKAFVRVLNGELVIFQEFTGDGKVAVSVGGRDRVLPRAEWRKLPSYEG